MKERETLSQFIGKIRKILLDDDYDNVEIFGIGNCFIWACWFITHPQLFVLGKIYTTLGVLGNVYVWSAGFFFLATLKLYGLHVDRYLVRQWIALLATMVWIFVFATFILENSAALLVAITGYIVLISAWEFFRHSRHHEVRDAARQVLKEDLEKI